MRLREELQPFLAFARGQSARRLIRRKAVLDLCYKGTPCSASQAPSSMHFQSAHHPQVPRTLRGTDLATHAPWFLHVPFAPHARTPLLPTALASVSFGCVLVRVRVRVRGRVPNLVTAAVESEVSKSHFFYFIFDVAKNVNVMSFSSTPRKYLLG
jgi:hypothetical protein